MTTPASRSTLVRPDGGPRRTDRGHWSRFVSELFLTPSRHPHPHLHLHLHQAIQPGQAPAALRTHPDRDRRTTIGLLGIHERQLSPHVNRPHTSGT